MGGRFRHWVDAVQDDHLLRVGSSQGELPLERPVVEQEPSGQITTSGSGSIDLLSISEDVSDSRCDHSYDGARDLPIPKAGSSSKPDQICGQRHDQDYDSRHQQDDAPGFLVHCMISLSAGKYSVLCLDRILRLCQGEKPTGKSGQGRDH